MKFFSDIFKDIDGYYSSKRTAFFLFILLFGVLTGGVYFKVADAATLAFLKDALGYVSDIIKWLGAFIVSERAQVFAPKGNNDGNSK